jgi:hypothetical protein
MPRNLLVIAKICPNVDAGVDAIIGDDANAQCSVSVTAEA